MQHNTNDICNTRMKWAAFRHRQSIIEERSSIITMGIFDISFTICEIVVKRPRWRRYTSLNSGIFADVAYNARFQTNVYNIFRLL